MNLARTLLLGATFGTSAFLASCESISGSLNSDTRIPLPTGGEVNVVIGVGINGAKTADIKSTPPICTKFCFLDSEGASLGCQTIETPGTAQIPDEAVGFSASIVPCPKEVAGGNGGGGTGGGSAFAQTPGQQIGGNPQRRLAVPYASNDWTLFGGNITPVADGSTNVSYSFQIKAPTLAQAKTRRNMVLAGGIGTVVGAGFDVVYYNESESESDVTGLPTGVRMRQAEVNDSFTSYRLTVNNVVFAELGITGNLLHYGASNQWDVIETFVPTSAFNTNPSVFDNQAEADWTSANTPIMWRAMQRVFTN